MKFDILRYLDEHRIPLAEAARAAGMAPQNIKKCLEGNPKVGNFLSIANGLGLDVRDFFYPDTEDNTDDAANASKAPSNGLFAQQPQEQEAAAQEAENGKGADEAQDAREMMYCPHCGTKFFVVNVPTMNGANG